MRWLMGALQLGSSLFIELAFYQIQEEKRAREMMEYNYRHSTYNPQAYTRVKACRTT